MEKKRGKRSKPLDDGLWDCSVCTYKNSAEAFKCAICGIRKGTSTRKPKPNPQLVAQQVAQQLGPPLPKKPSVKKSDRIDFNSDTSQDSHRSSTEHQHEVSPNFPQETSSKIMTQPIPIAPSSIPNIPASLEITVGGITVTVTENVSSKLLTTNLDNIITNNNNNNTYNDKPPKAKKKKLLSDHPIKFNAAIVISSENSRLHSTNINNLSSSNNNINLNPSEINTNQANKTNSIHASNNTTSSSTLKDKNLKTNQAKINMAIVSTISSSNNNNESFGLQNNLDSSSLMNESVKNFHSMNSTISDTYESMNSSSNLTDSSHYTDCSVGPSMIQDISGNSINL